jgi:hypothetical protein
MFKKYFAAIIPLIITTIGILGIFHFYPFNYNYLEEPWFLYYLSWTITIVSALSGFFISIIKIRNRRI